MFDELHTSDMQGDQMEVENGLTRSFIDELHSWDIQGYQMEAESMVLLEVSLIKLILGILKEIKWKLKVVLREVSLMNFILGISKDIKWKEKAWF